MPFKRRKTLRRKVYRRRRPLVSRIPRYRKPRAHFELFRESIEVVATTSAGGVLAAVLAPTIGQISQISSYNDLYSQYKVFSFDIHWLPYFQPTNAAGALVDQTMARAFDPTSNNAPTTFAQMLEYKKVKISNALTPWKMRIYPQIFYALDPNVSQAYGTRSSKSTWIDFGNNSVILHGLMIYVSSMGLASTAVGKFIITYNFICRNQT